VVTQFECRAALSRRAGRDAPRRSRKAGQALRPILGHNRISFIILVRKRVKRLWCSGEKPKALWVNEGKRRSSICRFGTGLRTRTARLAVTPSTTGLLDPVLNDDPLTILTHEVLTARRFVNPRRPAIWTCLRCHNRDSM